KMRCRISRVAVSSCGPGRRDARGRPTAQPASFERTAGACAAFHWRRPRHPRSHSKKSLRCLVAPADGFAPDEAATGGPSLSSILLAARMTPKLEAAFRACRGVARRSSSNFACIDWLLPLDQRRGTEALYAFARRSDDIADSPDPLDIRRQRLARWRLELRQALAGHAEDPILVAL